MYVNALSPPGPVSTATLGQRSFLVIARLVLPGGAEEWWPARTVRWVDTQVQIVFEPAGDPVYVWLAADDVRRTIHMPATVDAVKLHGGVDLVDVSSVDVCCTLSDRVT